MPFSFDYLESFLFSIHWRIPHVPFPPWMLGASYSGGEDWDCGLGWRILRGVRGDRVDDDGSHICSGHFNSNWSLPHVVTSLLKNKKIEESLKAR